ncbi:helix-turn-helix domain-containing protein [Guptibacillus hwajinpoensis]|uniref:helix-turn-helix domain-containing protein n=1 Tax=Guptibacillus hwajinpoensis TaxID=208199 RepID=UPI001CD5AFBE|nr:helix-turn-helix domain-containing protein [Pseudalkalibacillus hwajinpoensis]MCA0991162.1 helix-turn-helix domain-containing protein [Pseudalkalibacillus hwajinpoensis]
MEKRLYTLLQQAKNEDKEGLSAILDQFEKKIEAELRQTPAQNRDDLRQELVIKVMEAVEKYRVEDVPNFEQFIEAQKRKK